MVPAAEVGAGFTTSQPRAIVGEGSRVWPEYVIPTDPKYRGRAVGLMQALAKDLGMARGGVIPELGLGGIVDFAKHLVSGTIRIGGIVLDAARAVAARAAIPIINGILAGMDATVGKMGVPGQLAASMGHKIGEGVIDWLKGSDEAAQDALPSDQKPSTQRAKFVATGGVLPAVAELIAAVSQTTRTAPSVAVPTMADLGRGPLGDTLIRTPGGGPVTYDYSRHVAVEVPWRGSDRRDAVGFGRDVAWELRHH
jgi:hypothetical protein